LHRPRGRRAGHGPAAVAVPRRRSGHRGHGSAPQTAHRQAAPLGCPGGLPRRRRRLAAGPRLRRAALRPRAGAAARPPARRLAMSGFTATGATVLTDVEALGPDMLFWRQLTHWLGGMGIIVLALAVLPRLRIGGRELLRSELPGPVAVESLDATVRGTAQRLWKVYLAVTAAGFLALAALGWAGLDRRMGLFDAFSYATSAVSLGGFTPDADSARGLAPVTQWVLCGLMAVAGVNLLRLYRLAALRQVRAAARDDELRLYLALLAVATAVLGAELCRGGLVDGFGGVRHAVVQMVSVTTTTGVATLDWSTWGTLATVTLLLLMFAGARAGSASGSVKVVRHLVLFRFARRELDRAVHPDAVVPVRVSGR